ncbi:uncharacterized protein LOC125069117 [Vanessa atalanta]|uniref:uncharacterized protein LOC125069117 n=1 Tax=Vanessa atalanta TaxID=42275 RepID=UPI001FCD9BA8|nr:uncharacterized protein LOC125069117 [Vanessa atalanta]
MIFLSLFVSCGFGLVSSIDIINIANVWGTDPLGIYVSWHSIYYSSKHDVSGYKVKLWTVKMSTEKKYGLVNAEQYPGLIQNDITLEKYQVNTTLSSIPREIIVNGNFQSQVLITDVEYNVIYELRLLAFKDNIEGPMSEPRRIKIVKGDGYHAVIQKLPTGCLFSVPNVLRHNGDDYPFVQDSYI